MRSILLVYSNNRTSDFIACLIKINFKEIYLYLNVFYYKMKLKIKFNIKFLTNTKKFHSCSNLKINSEFFSS